MTSATHTDPAGERAPSNRKGMGGLYVTDAELIRRLGVPEKICRRNLRFLDGKPHLGFPKKQEFWGDRRFMPLVEEWLRANAGFKMDASPNGRHRP